jgi:hypothetical protein
MINFDGKSVDVDKEKQKRECVKLFKVRLAKDGEVTTMEIERLPSKCRWMRKNLKK